MKGWTLTGSFAIAATAVSVVAHASEEGTCSAAHVRAQVLRRDAPDRLLERRAALRTCSSALCAKSIVNECTAWLAGIDPLVPTLTVRVVDSRGTTVGSASIKVDGTTQTPGQPIELNPGEHAVVATSGTVTESRSIVIQQGETNRVLDIAIAPNALSPGSPFTPIPPGKKDGAPGATWVFYGIGTAGVAVAAVGLSVILTNSPGLSRCPHYECPSTLGPEVHRYDAGWVLLSIGGAVAIAGAIIGTRYLLSASPSARQDAWSVVLGGLRL